MCNLYAHRCFLSGVSVPLIPVKSRILEAVCILLCQKHPETWVTSDAGKIVSFNAMVDGIISCVGGQRRAYLSRWKLVLREHNALRACVFNSAGLLEETNLALYIIN